ncbi:hypothetical protein [Staphylococcus succinus]|uniref:hypothetical protein n=1 Tax=Staphylococcus succinus TaxID=61015 RepID=UPI00301CB902
MVKAYYDKENHVMFVVIPVDLKESKVIKLMEEYQRLTDHIRKYDDDFRISYVNEFEVL